MWVFTVGATGQLQCLNKKTGHLIWSRELYKEFNGTVLARGYSSSPIAYGDLVIVPVGGQQHGLVAFRQLDGSVAWKGQDFRNSRSFSNSGSLCRTRPVGGADAHCHRWNQPTER